MKKVYFIALLLGVYLVIALSASGISVDRFQEDYYLGVPYCMFNPGNHLFIGPRDPFPQNGAITVFIPAWVYFSTKSLYLTRLYFGLWTLLALALTCALLKKCLTSMRVTQANWPLLFFVIFAVWVSIPKLLPYSLQTNGTIWGFCAFIGGLICYPKKKYSAYFLWGLAAHFKGQFLGFAFGLPLYFAIVHFSVKERSFSKKIFSLTRELFDFGLCFFGATAIFALLVYAPLGWVKDFEHLRAVGFSVFTTLMEEVNGAILGTFYPESLPPTVKPLIQQRRRDIFGSFSTSTWTFIYTSILFCLTWFIAKTTRFLPRLKESPLCIVACCGLIYWLNYLTMYAYPYFYVVLPILWFSMLFVASGVALIEERYPKSKNLLWVLALALAIWGINRHTPLFHLRESWGKGNSVADYQWVKPGMECKLEH